MERLVVVTGASADAERVTAIAFALCGWNVALPAWGRDGLERVRRNVGEAGGRALVAQFDAVDVTFGTADRVATEWGWKNKAAAMVSGPIGKTSASEFKA